MKSSSLKQGFTLLELITVIAIIAIVTIVGLKSYGNLKKSQAKKMNLSVIKQLQHHLSTYDLIREGEAGKFNYFDSLIDGARGIGAWTGAEGTYKWTGTAVSGETGIYDGSWKFLLPVYNAAGKGGSTPTEAEAKDANKGTRNTGLLSKLAIYYLTTNDVQLLSNAGIAKYMLHNPSSAQASLTLSGGAIGGYFTNVVKRAGGGPGFRPDMSACFPADLSAGMPVAILKPVIPARGGRSFAVSSAYVDFGFPYEDDSAAFTSEEDGEDVISATGVKFVCLGIGYNAEAVMTQSGIDAVPVDNIFDKTNYRNYIAVFALSSAKAQFAGVLDASGKTYREAEYDVNWQSSTK